MNQDPTDLAALDHAQSELDKLAQAAAARERDDFRWLMAHRQGRRIVWRYLSQAGVFHSGFVPGDGGRGTARLTGRREMGLVIWSDVMTHTPELYIKMANEAAEPAALD
jgi:hypothetical protein